MNRAKEKKSNLNRAMNDENEKTQLWKVYGILMGVMVGGALLILGGQAAWNALQQNTPKATVENKPPSTNSVSLTTPEPAAEQSQTLSKNSIPSNQEIGTQDEIDKIADQIFYDRYPELAGRKLRNDEYSLQEEWYRIKQCEAVVDYIFYQRHPELGKRKLVKSDSSLTQEWLTIKPSVTGCQ